MLENYKQIWAKKERAKKRILKLCPNITNNSGIYIFEREENNIKHAYIGQAVHLLDRCADHLLGYMYIDLSIKNHGLHGEKENGYKLSFVEYPEHKLNEMERHFIESYANSGYQLKNKTLGGQDKGKYGINQNKASKGYYDGVAYGYEKCRKEVKELFTKYLVFDSQEPFNKIKERKKQEFHDFLFEK